MFNDGKLVAVHTTLTADQRQRVLNFMKESNIRHFSDGLREYVSHLEGRGLSSEFVKERQ